MMLKSFLFAGLAILVDAQGQSLTQVLSSNSDLSQLAGLVSAQPQLAQQLSSATNITVLAPNNAAIARLLNSTAGAAAAKDPGAVAAILSYHVLQGTIFGSQITANPAFVPTLLNNASYANVTGGQRVEAQVVSGNVTFFSGSLQNSTVVTANQNFTGGTVHVINRVLTLPTKVSQTLVDARLTALYGALNKTSLLTAVDGLKDVTIFAPQDSAFQNIGSALPNISTADLSKILTYHVVNGSSPVGYSTNLRNTTLKTLGGSDVTIRLRNGSVFVNNAKVVTPNVLVAGGVVHVIDQILNPGNATASVPDSATTGAPAFSGASSASSIPFTSGVPAPSTSVSGAASSSSSKAAAPVKTGAIGAAALFGAGAVWANL